MRQPSPSTIEQGINALDLIDAPEVSRLTFAEAVAKLESNYGVEYNPEKVSLLFDIIRTEGWSEERFKRTLTWFIKNKPFPAWTVADWFSYHIRVYPHEWYLQQCRLGTDVLKQMDKYRLGDGTIVYKWRDGEDLPFPKNGEIVQKQFKTLELWDKEIKFQEPQDQ